MSAARARAARSLPGGATELPPWLAGHGRFFLDTNVLVYCFDAREPGKQATARALVAEALSSQRGLISSQVVQELLNVATRRFAVPLRADDARLVLDEVLAPLCEVAGSVALCREALGIAERWQLSFYDALIVAGALAGHCETLYSEDLQDGLRIRELTVRNPFTGLPSTARS